MHFSLLFCFLRRRFLLYATSGLCSSCPRLARSLACTLELVCPSLWLSAWTAKRDEAHVKDAQHEMPGRQTLTHRVHQKDTSQTRANPEHTHTPKHCVVFCSNSLETGLWTGHMLGMALIRLLQTLPRIPLRPNYSVGKTRRTGAS
jgi:hypothetical protein